MMFNWYAEKLALRTLLNSCIRQHLTYEQTVMALEAQFNASCATCIICTMGSCVCDKHHVCFIEQALSTYIKIAKEKCHD